MTWGDKNLICLVSKRKVDDGEWHHVVGVMDGQRAALYVDGELEDSAAAKPIAQNNAPVMIGCNSTSLREAVQRLDRRRAPLRLWLERGGGQSAVPRRWGCLAGGEVG